jgi:molybdopterin converting factor small subunit
MVVTVCLIGSLRAASKKSKLTLKIEEAIPLREIIGKMVEEQPKLRQLLVDPELGEPKTNALILVNGKDISVLNGLETMLEDGDEVVFVPVVHGG